MSVVKVTLVNKFVDKIVDSFTLCGQNWKSVFVKYIKDEFDKDINENTVTSILVTCNGHLQYEDKRIYLTMLKGNILE